MRSFIIQCFEIEAAAIASMLEASICSYTLELLLSDSAYSDFKIEFDYRARWRGRLSSFSNGIFYGTIRIHISLQVQFWEHILHRL